MSKVYRCDRCGGIFGEGSEEVDGVKIGTANGKEVWGRIIRAGGYNDLDVCPNCYNSFRKWWYKHKLPSSVPVEDTILGKAEDIVDEHPQEVI